MITSLFSKSRPVNFFVVVAVLLMVYGLSNFEQFEFDNTIISRHLPIVAILLFYVFLLDFIISKNELTKRHSYGIMLIPLLIAAFPDTTMDVNLCVANLLVVFAMRRLLSLHTNQNLLKKFFDATFWIVLASLFYTWSLLFLVIVGFALLYYWQKHPRTVGVSLMAIITVAVLLLGYNIVVNDIFFDTTNFNFAINFDFESYTTLPKLVTLLVVFGLYVLSLVAYISNVSDINKKFRLTHYLVLLWSIVAMVVGILSFEKISGELIFTILPFCIVISNYLAIINKIWLRDAIVIGLALIPLIALVS